MRGGGGGEREGEREGGREGVRGREGGREGGRVNTECSRGEMGECDRVSWPYGSMFLLTHALASWSHHICRVTHMLITHNANNS